MLQKRFLTNPLHYTIAEEIKKLLQRYKELEDIIIILGLDELSEQDRQIVTRARKIERFLSQPLHVASVFNSIPGLFVPLKSSLWGLQAILSGFFDKIPEKFFFMKGKIDNVASA